MVRRVSVSVGQKFSKWAVLEEAKSINGLSAFLCKCECGTERVVRGYRLVSGRSMSCGCASRKTAGAKPRHGMHKSITYSSWVKMKSRCLDPKGLSFAHYGGRGIKVCDRWMSFENFFSDMGERPSKDFSIDRIDVNGNYEPGNCRWATRSEQAANKRKGLPRTPRSKGVLAPEQVLSIRGDALRGLAVNGYAGKKALELGCSREFVRLIAKGQTLRHYYE